MEMRDLRDRMVKKPGMLDHSGVDDAVLSMMSVNSKTWYYHVLWIQNLIFFKESCMGSKELELIWSLLKHCL